MKDHSAITRSLKMAMILQFAVGGALMPFISILLRDRGLTDSQVAHVFFAGSSTLLVFPFLWGMLSDRYLPMERIFTLLNLAMTGALVFFSLQTGFVGTLIAYTIFYACFNPTLVLMNALSFHHLPNPQQQFGVIRAWGSAGWIIPSLPISLWIIYSASDNLTFVVYLAMGLALAMAAATFLLPHTPPGTAKQGQDIECLPYWVAVRKLLTDPNYVTLVLSFFLIAGSFALFVFFSPLLLIDIGIHRVWIGPIQCIGVLLEVILFQWKPAFLKSWSYPSTILLGCLALLLRQILFAFSANPVLLCLSYLLAGMAIVFYYIDVSILVNVLARVEVRATAQTLLVFFGPALGPMFANWIAGRLTAQYPDTLRPVFVFAAILAALATLIIFLRRKALNVR